MKNSLIIVFSLLSIFSYSQKINNESKNKVVDSVKTLIAENYIITSRVSYIQRFDFLKADTTSTVWQFCDRFNSNLFRITHDKHLRIEHNESLYKSLLNNTSNKEEQRMKEKTENYGFEKVEILKNNIGYIKLNYFADTLTATKVIDSIFLYVKNTKSLIIDLSTNSGGSGAMLQLLCSYVLPKTQTPLLNISYRDNKAIQIKSNKSLPHNKYSNPLYLIIDTCTFSAGEGFAFILKNQKRAVLIGRTTAGAGNIAGPYPVSNGFVLTIPVGVISDPTTKKGWEGTGVQPNYICMPKGAIKKAVELISNRTINYPF